MSFKRQYSEASCSYPPPPLTKSYAYIQNKAKEILETPNVTGMAELVSNLFHGKETDESSSSKLLYESFTEHFPTIVVVKLLQVFRFAPVTPKIRSHSLTLLDLLLIYLDHSCVDLKTEYFNDIKTHLNSCLFELDFSDFDFKLLSRIIARVSFYFFVEYISWDELCSYIISFDMNNRALMIFSELPMVLDEDFLFPLLDNDLYARIVKGLSNPVTDDDWSLAFESGFNLMLQLVGKMKDYLINDLVYATVQSVWEMVNVRGKEIIVRKGFVKIARKVGLEAVRFREAEYEVVSNLALKLKKMNGIGEATEMAAKMIHQVLDKYYRPVNLDMDLDLVNPFQPLHGR